MDVPKFAYIKYVEDGITQVVDIEDIKKFNIDSYEYDPSKKYKVKYRDGHYYKAYIISLGKTKEEATEKAEAKRIRLPRKFNLDEDTEDTADSDGDNIPSVAHSSKNKKSYISENFKRILQDKNENIFKVPEISNLKVLKPDNPEVNKLKLEIEHLRNNETELTNEIQQLRDLNYKLQEDVISKFQNFDFTTSQEINNNKSDKSDDVPIGARRGNEIHLGRGVYVAAQIYDLASSRSVRKQSLFIKEIALAVFGEEVLKVSSVTGAISNRTKSKPKQPLDPTKLMAIHDIVRFRLESQGAPREKVEETLRSVNSRIAEKIYDLVRPPKNSEKIKRSTCHETSNEAVVQEDLIQEAMIKEAMIKEVLMQGDVQEEIYEEEDPTEDGRKQC